MTVDYRIGDTRDVTATIPDGSVALVATSPPFLALRSYLPADHHAKHAEIGSEPDPATFLDTLLGLTADWGRVLAPWGSIAIELGDTYAGNDNRGSSSDPGKHDGKVHSVTTGPGWPLAKSLALIPQLYAIALAYGINPLTGAASPAGRWRVRNVIVWHRPNPAVGALGDKFRPSTSYIVVATRDARRWFDLTAVRNSNSNTTRLVGGYAMVNGKPSHDVPARSLNPAGAPPLDCWTDEYDQHDTWTLTTQPSSLAHYAMWPAKLADRLVRSMCPEWVCRRCGEPRRRVEAAAQYVPSATYGGGILMSQGERPSEGVNQWKGAEGSRASVVRSAPTLGWTDCGCDAGWTPGVVLDPFCGTGTTLAVAHLRGRDAIGIDLDPRNHDLYPARLEEVRRSLFGSPPTNPDQLAMFGQDE